MTTTISMSRFPPRLGFGFVAGVAIAAVDNLAYEGEVSPIVIVTLMVSVTGAAGRIWGWRGWVASVVAWVSVPSVHVIKHVLGLPDTLQPNTYASILILAAFTLVVAAIGTSCGVLSGGRTTHSVKSNL